jgi:hypothetical protein
VRATTDNITKLIEETIAHGVISTSNKKGTIWFLKDYGVPLGYCPVRNRSVCKHGVLYNIEKNLIITHYPMFEFNIKK